MPAAFDRCVKAKGSRTRTIKPKGKSSPEYMHVCYTKAGKSFSGEVKTRQKSAPAPRIARLTK
jgi:hypothetical protein